MRLVTIILVGHALLLGSDGYAQTDSSAPPPKKGFLSSLGDSFKQAIDPKAVRGYFDAAGQRYYCLVDTKTGANQDAAVQGLVTKLDNGSSTINTPTTTTLSCDKVEKLGKLMLMAGSTNMPAPMGGAEQRAGAASTSTGIDVSALAIDVSGVKLGMSLDEVRAVLKAKGFGKYKEWTKTLAYMDQINGGGSRMIPNGQWVNVVATWIPPPPSQRGPSFTSDGESYFVEFTPVPGHERAILITHTVGYSTANAIRQSTLEDGLAKKYRDFPRSTATGTPASPSWIFEAGGAVHGDAAQACRLVAAVPDELDIGERGNESTNSALAGGWPQRCGVAMVMAEQYVQNYNAALADRIVTRFSVRAYSTALAIEGRLAAAELVHAAEAATNKAAADRVKDRPAPSL